MNNKSSSNNSSLTKSAMLDLKRFSTVARRGLVLAEELTSHRWKESSRHDDVVAVCLAISPNKHYELMGGYIGGSILFLIDIFGESEVPSSTLAEAPQGNAGTFEAVGFTGDSRLGLSVNRDNKSVQIWDLKNGREIRHFELHFGFNPNGHAIFSPNGQYLLTTASAEESHSVGIACVWEVMTGKLMYSFKTMANNRCMAFSRDGSLFLVGDYLSIKLYKADSGKQISQFDPISKTMNVGDLPLACAFSPDGSQVIAGNNDGSIRLWNARNGREIFHLEGHSNHIMKIAFSPSGLLVASGGFDKTVRIWDVKNQKQICRCDGHTDTIICLEFVSDTLLYSSSLDRTLRSWSPYEREK